jgi:hypothetical protein
VELEQFLRVTTAIFLSFEDGYVLRRSGMLDATTIAGDDAALKHHILPWPGYRTAWEMVEERNATGLPRLCRRAGKGDTDQSAVRPARTMEDADGAEITRHAPFHSAAFKHLAELVCASSRYRDASTNLRVAHAACPGARPGRSHTGPVCIGADISLGTARYPSIT